MKKKNVLHPFIGLALLAGMASCADEEKYATSVVKTIQMYLNDEAYAINTNSSVKPLFIYKEDGEYVANYSSQYRFQLPDGNYKIIATTFGDSIPYPENLNNSVIRQDPGAKQTYVFSAPVDYASPFDSPLELRMYTRTGVLRLKATDRKSDKSYSTVRAVVTTPVSGFKLADASFVEEQTEIKRDKATTTGGVNYTDDLVLFETNSINQEVAIRIDYLDAADNLVRSKEILGTFPVLPNDTLQIAFELNNEDEPVIQNYVVRIASEGWTEEDIYPDAPIRLPEGYTYVTAEEDLAAVFDKLLNDPTVSDIKLYLEAGGKYELGRKNDFSKSVYIVGAEPSSNQEMATIEMGNMSMKTGNATMDAIHFENLKIITTDDDFFKLKNQEFHVGEISLKNCEISDLGRCMWYQETNAARQQTVDNFIIEDCRFINLNIGKSSLIGPSTKQDAPISNIVFRNSTFHAKSLSKPLISGLSAMTGPLSITIENCTFVALPEGGSFFDLSPKNTDCFNLTVKNNLFSGVGNGTAFSLRNVTSSEFGSNYYTKGYELGWGIDDGEAPIETAKSMDELFRNVIEGDMTITDLNSEVYVNGIGDPYWRK